jgi:hypothetical protein
MEARAPNVTTFYISTKLMKSQVFFGGNELFLALYMVYLRSFEENIQRSHPSKRGTTVKCFTASGAIGQPYSDNFSQRTRRPRSGVTDVKNEEQPRNALCGVARALFEIPESSLVFGETSETLVFSEMIW